jgi:hypothetical protein
MAISGGVVSKLLNPDDSAISERIRYRGTMVG